MKRIAIFIIPLLFSGQILVAQNVKDQKTDSVQAAQREKEFNHWLKVKDDWPNLGRYGEADRELPPPARDEHRVVFMGNSITDVWIKYSPAFFSDNDFIDRGISGQTTPQMLIRFRQDVIDLHPEAVVILAGTNDIAGNTGPSTLKMIEDNIASMTQLAKCNGIKVILCSVLPVYDYSWRPGLEPAQKIVALNKWIKKYAKEQKVTFLDYYPHLVDDRGGMKAEYSRDGVHPNKAGYEIMEGLALKTIHKVLKK